MRTVQSRKRREVFGHIESGSVSIPMTGTDARVDRPVGACSGEVSLCRQEWSRKIWHMSGGLLPFLCPLLPYYDQAAAFWGPNNVRLMIICPAILFVGLSLKYSKKFARSDEKNAGVAMGCYVFCVATMLLAFPQHLELGMTVLAILSIGDGAAGLVGMTLKGTRLPWNPRKTVAGTLGFIVFAAPLATAAYWCSAPKGVTWGTAFALGCLASAVAALAESWQSRLNDNFRVGFAAAMVMVVNQWYLTGLA